MTAIQLAGKAELTAFLSAHPDIQAVQIMITDPSGVLRGKAVLRSELERIFDTGRQVAGSILGLDITGKDVDDTGLVWDTGDADMTARPIARTLTRAPWLATPTGQLMLTMFDGEGRPAAADPRHALVRVVERFLRSGITPVVACELEFYLLKEGAGGVLAPAGGGRASERQKIDAYSLQRLDDLAPLFNDVYAAAVAQGLPAETLMSEYSPGQFEITLHHRDDALRAVDEAVMFKRVLRGVAQKHGLIACFMAKPFTARAGSGLHVHVSLNDAQGKQPVRQRRSGGHRKPAPGHRRHEGQHGGVDGRVRAQREFLSSLRQRELCARRAHLGHQQSLGEPARAGGPAGVAARGASHLRRRRQSVPGSGHGVGRCRAWIARTAGSRRAGGRQRLRTARCAHAAGQLARGARLAAKSEFLEETLGKEFLKIFLAIKNQECARFSAEVSELDYAWYLRS